MRPNGPGEWAVSGGSYLQIVSGAIACRCHSNASGLMLAMAWGAEPTTDHALEIL